MNFTALVRSPFGTVVLETVLLACLMLGTFSVLVRTTDVETMGLWVLVNAILGFSRAADLWSAGLSSFIGEARGRGDAREATAFVTTAVGSGALTYALAAAVGASIVWCFAATIAGVEHASLVRKVLPVMVVTFWLQSVSSIYQLGFLGFGRPGLKAFQTVGGASIFLAAALVLAPVYGLLGIVVAQALQGAAMLAFAVVAFHGFVAPELAIVWRQDHFRRLVIFGGKASVLGGVQLAIEPLIRILASWFGGIAFVAVVEMASRLIMVTRSVITSIGQILIPEFARLGVVATGEIAKVHRSVNRLFFLASLSLFSIPISASPAVQEIVFGRKDVGLVQVLLLLSAGWIASTLTAPTYFLMIGQRHVRPLFWSHLVQLAGVAVLGTVGGLIFGGLGVISGAAIALIAASGYLLRTTRTSAATIESLLSLNPRVILPLAVACCAAGAIEISDVLDGRETARVLSYVAATGATLLACVMFGEVRGMLKIAERLS